MQSPLAAPTGRSDATVIVTEAFTLVKVPPPASLAGLVMELALYRETAGYPIRQMECASLVVPLLIGFADPFAIAIGAAPARADAFHSFTAGLTLKPVDIRSAGACSCLQVNLTPLGARRFFRLPMSELTGQIVTMDDLGDPALTRLRQELGQEPSWDRRFARAQAFLLDRMRQTAETPRAVDFVYQNIVASGGRAAISQLALAAGWTRKHLAARFHDAVGLPPKQVARIVRFDRARRLAASDRASGWADVAAACGYADQAHLVREFREFSGQTPSAWLSRTDR